MNREREFIDGELSRLAIGQMISIDAALFELAFPYGPPSIYRNCMEAFLSSRVGSAWGCWTVRQDPRGSYIIGHHKGDETRRVYCDPDREDLFIRLPSGELVPRP